MVAFSEASGPTACRQRGCGSSWRRSLLELLRQLDLAVGQSQRRAPQAWLRPPVSGLCPPAPLRLPLPPTCALGAAGWCRRARGRGRWGAHQAPPPTASPLWAGGRRRQTAEAGFFRSRAGGQPLQGSRAGVRRSPGSPGVSSLRTAPCWTSPMVWPIPAGCRAQDGLAKLNRLGQRAQA